MPSRRSASRSTIRCSRTFVAAWTGPASPTNRGVDWDAGLPVDYLRELVGYWRQSVRLAGQEQRLNGFEHFRTRIDGQSIHFIHARSPHPDALPLMITHGWPGSVVEFLDLIPRLTDPPATVVGRRMRST